MERINPLICIPSPRDIPEFLEATQTLPYDKFWVKYHKEARAYQLIREFFLNHKEYTHLVLLPDDLIATPECIERLIQDLREKPVDVISGMCNPDINENVVWNICDALPSLDESNRLYKWRNDNEIDGEIVRAAFSGFALLFLSRPVVRLLSFAGDRKGTSFDVVMCHELHRFQIAIHVDTRVRMHHLKGRRDQSSCILVGKKSPETYLEKFSDPKFKLAWRRRLVEKAYHEFYWKPNGMNDQTNQLLGAIVDEVLSRLPGLEAT